MRRDGTLVGLLRWAAFSAITYASRALRQKSTTYAMAWERLNVLRIGSQCHSAQSITGARRGSTVSGRRASTRATGSRNSTYSR